MAATCIVFVRADGTVERDPVSDHLPGLWILRVCDGDLVVAFERAHYACSKVSDDDQKGVIVFAERPLRLYLQERERYERDLDHVTRRLREMPTPEWVLAREKVK